MGISDDSFSIELKHPIDKESWKVIEDAELDNTEHIYFTTPSNKRVDFIKADVFEKIRERVELELGYSPSVEYYKAIMKCLQIIDKYNIDKE